MYRDTMTFIWAVAEFLVNNFEKEIFIEIQFSGYMTSLVSDLPITMKPKQLKALSMRCKSCSIYAIYLIFVTPRPKKNYFNCDIYAKGSSELPESWAISRNVILIFRRFL